MIQFHQLIIEIKYLKFWAPSFQSSRFPIVIARFLSMIGHFQAGLKIPVALFENHSIIIANQQPIDLPIHGHSWGPPFLELALSIINFGFPFHKFSIDRMSPSLPSMPQPSHTSPAPFSSRISVAAFIYSSNSCAFWKRSHACNSSLWLWTLRKAYLLIL